MKSACTLKLQICTLFFTMPEIRKTSLNSRPHVCVPPGGPRRLKPQFSHGRRRAQLPCSHGPPGVPLAVRSAQSSDAPALRRLLHALCSSRRSAHRYVASYMLRARLVHLRCGYIVIDIIGNLTPRLGVISTLGSIHCEASHNTQRPTQLYGLVPSQNRARCRGLHAVCGVRLRRILIL